MKAEDPASVHADAESGGPAKWRGLPGLRAFILAGRSTNQIHPDSRPIQTPAPRPIDSQIDIGQERSKPFFLPWRAAYLGLAASP